MLVISSLYAYKNTIIINISIDVLLLTSSVPIEILDVKITLIISLELINSEYVNEELIDNYIKVLLDIEVLLVNIES